MSLISFPLVFILPEVHIHRIIQYWRKVYPLLIANFLGFTDLENPVLYWNYLILFICIVDSLVALGC